MFVGVDHHVVGEEHGGIACHIHAAAVVSITFHEVVVDIRVLVHLYRTARSDAQGTTVATLVVVVLQH